MPVKLRPECCPPEDVPSLSGDEERDLAMLAKAVGHPARVRIIKILVDRGECLSGGLAEEIGLAPSTVSEHLRVLKEAGLVRGTIDGPRRCYCVNKDTLKLLKRLIAQL